MRVLRQVVADTILAVAAPARARAADRTLPSQCGAPGGGARYSIPCPRISASRLSRSGRFGEQLLGEAERAAGGGRRDFERL